MNQNEQRGHSRRRTNLSHLLSTTAAGVGIIAVSATSAHAQSVSSPDTNPEVDPNVRNAEVENLAGFTGNWGGGRQSLEEEEITPFATYTGELFNNHSGGIENGSAWAGLLDVGLELDLEKLAGWKGARVLVNVFYFHGGDLSGDQVGDFNAVSNLYTDTSFNFYNIFLQQEFGTGDSFFKIGQIALDDDFMVSESSLLFLNAGFGPMPVQSANTAAPIYALAAPGAVIHYVPTEKWFVQGGIYTGDAGAAASGNQGFDWNTGSASGWMFIAETGFRYGAENGSVAKVGGYYHSGEYARFSDGAYGGWNLHNLWRD